MKLESVRAISIWQNNARWNIESPFSCLLYPWVGVGLILSIYLITPKLQNLSDNSVSASIALGCNCTGTPPPPNSFTASRFQRQLSVPWRQMHLLYNNMLHFYFGTRQKTEEAAGPKCEMGFATEEEDMWATEIFCHKNYRVIFSRSPPPQTKKKS